MSKKFITVLVILVILVGALGVYSFLLQNTNPQDNFLGNFFPFGQGSDSDNTTIDTTNNTGDQNTNGIENVLPSPPVRKITSEQVAGATLIETASTTKIRYIERGTGHVYEGDSLTLSLKKISNTTVPKIYEAFWVEKGDSVLLRYLKDDNQTIETFYAKLSSLPGGTNDDSVSDLEGSFLPANILEVAISPDKNSIFSLTSSLTGGSGSVSRPDGSKKLTFSLPVASWLVSWPSQGSVLLSTKPNSDVPGYVYALNSSSGTLNKILGEVNGVTASADKNFTYLLYSESKQKSISLNMLEIRNGTIVQSPSKTLPEKCVWSKKEPVVVYCAVPKAIPNNNYPDAWYQGLVSFSDKIWKIDFKNSITSVITDTKESANEEVDAVSLSLSSNEDYLIFINKKDSSLWGIKIIP